MNARIAIILATVFFTTEAFSEFITPTIPPSSNKNFFRDTNMDGRMDRLELYFLGNITQDYLKNTIDSVCFTWPDTLALTPKYCVSHSVLYIDSTSSRRLFYDLPKSANIQPNLTELTSLKFEKPYGSVMLYYKTESNSIIKNDSSELQMKDGMAPVIKEASLKSTQGKGTDTLLVTFSEGVLENQEGTSIFEFKSSKDSAIRELRHSTIQWNLTNTQATLTFGTEVDKSQRLLPRDSIRLRALATKDMELNKVPENSPFHSVPGTYPFTTFTNPSAEFFANDSLKRMPIFQLLLMPFESNSPSSSEMGIAIDIGGQELENAVKETLRDRRKNQVEGLDLSEIVVEPEKLFFSLELQIFTNHGAYVASTHSETSCTDSRFSSLSASKGNCLSDSKRLFLRWNFMSVDHRIVGTGVFIVKTLVAISYDGLVIYRNDQESGESIYSWGVFRR